MRALLREPRELIRALPVLAFAAVVPLLLRLPLPRLSSVLEPQRARRSDAERQRWLEAHIDDVLAAGHPVVRPGCLTRGLTLYWFMSRAGADVHLQFGMGRPAGELEGHCWLVRNGEPYLEKVDPRAVFAPTYTIPARA